MMKSTLLGLMLLTAGLLAQEPPAPAPPAKPAITHWQYLVHTATLASGENEKLAQFGAEGWELVTVVQVDALYAKPEPDKPLHKHAAHLRYYFKRAKLN